MVSRDMRDYCNGIMSDNLKSSCTIGSIFVLCAQLICIIYTIIYYNFKDSYFFEVITPNGSDMLCNINFDNDVERVQRLLNNLEKNRWQYLKSNFAKLKSDCKDELTHDVLMRQIQVLSDDSMEQHSIAMGYLHKLEEANQEWRKAEVEALSHLVQERIRRLQNPDNCSSARKLVCKIHKPCGFGCQVHLMLYCFITAIGTNRTFVLDSYGWHYDKRGWEENFLPLSDNCRDRDGVSSGIWNEDTVRKDVQVLELYQVYYYGMHPSIPQLPLTVPADIAPRLRVLHERPGLWFLAQLLHYLLRPQPHIQRMLDDMEAKLNFTRPIVGVHVRRTDKVGVEAAFHPIEEYMVHVDEWWENFEQLHGKGFRQIYLATDDSGLLEEMRQQFPRYQVISNNTFSQTANLNSRYTENSLLGIIADVYFLSKCNHIVCTLSSQVCRLAYELKQTLHPDATQHVTSIDKQYSYRGAVKQYWLCVHPHVPHNDDELQAHIGDLIEVVENLSNGFIKGKNKRTRQIGALPVYKLEKYINEVNFPW